MAAYVLRLWLPDRPGALGLVASRIGSARGDVVGIDILERGGGRAIDELLVELPEADLVPLMLAQVGEVDGVDVEDIQDAPAPARDPRLDALEAAAGLLGEQGTTALLERLMVEAGRGLLADWAAVIDLGAGSNLGRLGPAPPTSWLTAFVAGHRAGPGSATSVQGPPDVAWAALGGLRLALLLGRGDRPFRARERRQLQALADIAGHRWADLTAARDPPAMARR